MEPPFDVLDDLAGFPEAIRKKGKAPKYVVVRGRETTLANTGTVEPNCIRTIPAARLVEDPPKISSRLPAVEAASTP
jgi:hypothetical protein